MRYLEATPAALHLASSWLRGLGPGLLIESLSAACSQALEMSGPWLSHPHEVSLMFPRGPWGSCGTHKAKAV